MNKILLITKNELLQFFSGLSAYIFLLVFTAIISWFFAMPLFVNNIAGLNSFFNTVQLLFIVFLPIITMNLLAKEKQIGTMELLYTMPLKVNEIIIGKFLSGIVIVMISLFPSIVFLLTILSIGVNVDLGIIFCGYFSLFLTSSLYCSIGVFSGVLSGNQVITFVLSFIIILFLFLLDNILFFLPIYLTPFFQYLSITWQNSNLIKGVIDSRVMVYFFSLIFGFLWLSVNILEIKRNK